MARYIDVEALKNDGHPCWHDGEGNIYYEVDHAPTADVEEVKHGKWKDHPYFYHCELCNKWLDIEQGTADMNYCPHCGAKMDGQRSDYN